MQNDQVKDSFGTHKWLGRMLLALGFGNVDADITYHLQAAARAIYSNKWILLDTNVSINSEMKLFETSVTSIACFVAGHRNIRQRDVRILVVEIRSLDWCGPWRATLRTFDPIGEEASGTMATACMNGGQENKYMAHND